MKDLAIALDNRPGALAEMGEALGRAGVSVEGGGAWVVRGDAVAHFLFEDGAGENEAYTEHHEIPYILGLDASSSIVANGA